MKFLYYLFVSLFLPLTLLAQQRVEEQERERIAKNNIKKSVQWNHRYSQGKPNPNGFKTIETFYDRKGNPIEIINFRANGDTSSRILYKYNAQNQRIEYLLFQKVHGPFIELSYKQSSNYNEKGQKNVEVVFDGTSTHRILYTYYPNGDPKQTTKIAPGNRIEERWEYIQKDARTQEINVYIPNDVLSYTLTRVHDTEGNMLYEIRRNPAGDEVRRMEYEYYSQGRTKQMSEYYLGNLLKKLIYSYGSDGRVAEIFQELPDGKRFTHSTYKYDGEGNVIEERWTESDSGPLSHKISTYNQTGSLKELDSFYAPYNFKVLYKYTYEYY